MGRNRQKKRKKTNSSGDEENNSKIHRQRGPDSGISENSDNTDTEGTHIKTIEVSDILNETNSVLFDESVVFEENQNLSSKKEPSSTEMASNQTSPRKSESSAPTNSDIMMILKKIESRIGNVEHKLMSLDKLEKKVDEVDNDMKKLWLNMDKIQKRLDEKMVKLDDRMDSVEFNDAQQQSMISQLEKENEKLKDSISYLQSQSMRNNLIFGNIPEKANEKPAETEEILRRFMTEKLKMAQELVDTIGIERVHRMGGQNSTQDLPRKIVCKFTLFKDRESVRQNSKELKGSDFFVHEQFPPDVVTKRKALIPHLKSARKENKSAWISYDTLYVEGKPVKID